MFLHCDDNIPTIPEFFKNKNVFVTGGSGFVGKVLIEKLLRSCADIGMIYVLMREKKGRTIQERVKDISNTKLFDLLKKQNGDAINKIIPIKGDVCKLRLGISDEDRNTIINEVSIVIMCGYHNVVFHVAASVRFDDHLKKAILFNVRSAVEVANLTKELKNLPILAHVSTAYCNAEHKVIEEKLYPARVDWREAIRLAEESDEYILQTLTEKYIKPLPNTYTFTKSLAEHVVNDLCGGQIPAIIFRPTIVVNSKTEPVPGWVDNFNGPYALSMASATGLMRTSYCLGDVISDTVFVDNVAKSLIVAVWEKRAFRDKTFEVSVYNCSSDFRISLKDYETIGHYLMKTMPAEKKIWSPTGRPVGTNCYYAYLINVILFHMIPAVIIDGILKLVGKKPLLVGIQRKVYIANISIYYFMSNTWEFKNECYHQLEDKLVPDDLEEFTFRPKTDLSTYDEMCKCIAEALLGCKEYLLNESRNISSRTLLIDKSLRILDSTLKSAAFGLVLYTIFLKYNIQTYLLEIINSYINRL